MCKQAIVFSAVQHLVDVSLRHQPGQSFPLLRVLCDKSLQILDAQLTVILQGTFQSFQIRLQNQSAAVNQLVQHSGKRQLNILIPDRLDGTFGFVSYMCSTAPCGILATFAGVHPALKCTTTFCTPDKSGKRITVLIFIYAFLNVFLYRTLFQKNGNSVKVFSADDCLVVLLHTVHIHLTRVPVPVELFIREGLL